MKPFKYGCVVSGDVFCPRPELQRRLVTCVKDGQNAVLVGERRMGKTSLIYSVCNALEKYRMMYIDLLNIRTVADFCNRIATAAAQMGDKDSFVSRALKFMARLRPTLSVDPGSGMPVVSVDSRMAEDPESMSDVMTLIERFSKDERMFVVFDEFQEVKRLDAADQVLAMLRGKIQFLQDTCFVFSGSVRNDMVDIFTNPGSPFFKSAMTISVGNIPDDVRPAMSSNCAPQCGTPRKQGQDFPRPISSWHWRRYSSRRAVRLKFRPHGSRDISSRCLSLWRSLEDATCIRRISSPLRGFRPQARPPRHFGGLSPTGLCLSMTGNIVFSIPFFAHGFSARGISLPSANEE